MRFLIGIIIGTILTLFIATAVDAPTHPALEQAQLQIAKLWDGLIDTTSESLFPATDPAAGPEAVDPAADQTEELDESRPAAAGRGAIEQVARSAAEPALALAAPEPVPRPPPAGSRRAPAGVAARDEPTSVIEPATLPLPDTLPNAPAADRFGEDAGLLLAAAAVDPAAVWVPFHSQMSAEGFASRLSRELNHSFRVERQGAGAYQVVFDASTHAERDLLLAQIAEITGQ